MQAIQRSQFIWLIGLSFLVILWKVVNDITPIVPTPEVNNISIAEAYELIAATGVLVLDVREKRAYEKDHLPNAVSVPIGQLDERLDEFEAHKLKDIVVYCNEGSKRGPRATAKLNEAGYAGARNLEGGIEAWRTTKPKK